MCARACVHICVRVFAGGLVCDAGVGTYVCDTRVCVCARAPATVCVRAPVCVRASVCARTLTITYVCTHAGVCVRARVCAYACVCVRVSVCTGMC